MHYDKRISVIIPNYNGKNLLWEYLPDTLTVLNESELEYEIIIVDDLSTDDSVDFIKEHYSDVKLIVNQQNRGFAYSCNRGIEVAKFELVFLLNSDVKLTRGYFDSQLKYFSKADTFGVMGRIIDMEGDNIQDTARMPKFSGFKLKTLFYYNRRAEDQVYTLYLSGANALIDASKLKELGGFNEMLSPFYGEDLELSLRAWRSGWKCYYEHSSICRHKVSASTNDYNTPQWVKSIYFRNRFYVHALHLEGLPLLLWFLQITLVDLFPKLLFGQFWIWKSYVQFIKSFDKISQYRKLFKTHAAGKGVCLSLFEVIDFINKDIATKEIIRLEK